VAGVTVYGISVLGDILVLPLAEIRK